MTQSHAQDIHRMHHLGKRAIASLSLLWFGLILPSCSWSLPSIPYLNKNSLFQEKVDAPVEPHHRFVRVTPEPVAPVDPPQQFKKAEKRETEPIETTKSRWQIPLGETVELAPTAQEQSGQAAETTHEDKDMTPASAEAREEAAPEQLTGAASQATRAAAVSPEVKPADMTKKVSALRPEKKTESAPRRAKVIRVHLASLGTQNGADLEWRELNDAHLDLLGGVTSYITKVNVRGKGTYFRLYAGEFLELKKASALCKALKTRKQYCKPVLFRN